MARSSLQLVLLNTLLALVGASSFADDAAKNERDGMSPSRVEQIAERARKSIVEITFAGRDGDQQGLGTGFVIDADGLIATNLHVIGEARPISVRTVDGKRHDVLAVHASDRNLDLAVLKIANSELKPLALAEGPAAQGAPIVVMGNPYGLRNSVVAGVLSGRQTIADREMLQLAIPIEPGNSGGPVIDEAGRVLGIVTMKSAVTNNLGFAVPIEKLRPLLEQPNPIPLQRWLTIGALDDAEWSPRFGARWMQRAGRIFVSQPGQGFGGRSLLLRETELPDLPYEIAVQVKLDDEGGAAGIVFHSDDDQRHYGFYPSAGNLRLTCFNGPSVYSWQVLFNEPCRDYKPGEWNQLKVRVEQDKIACFVNDALVVESHDKKILSGKVGLAKFRDTKAEFKQFLVAKHVPSALPSAASVAIVEKQLDGLPSLEDLLPEELASLTGNSTTSAAVLRRQAETLDERAKHLRALARDVHVQAVVAELAALASARGEPIDLLRGALLIARLDDEELTVEPYLEQVDRMATDIREALAADAPPAACLAALDHYLFEQNGFHGSRTEYYHRANSYLNRVLDDREGLPITLSLLYMELAKRLDLQVEGIALPGHFIVRFQPEDGEGQLIDVFDGAKRLSLADAERRVRELAGLALEPAHLEPAPPRAILLRMLGNLRGLAQNEGDKEALLRYVEASVAINPEGIADRGLRALARFETGRRRAALADLDWFLENEPAGIDLDRIRQMRDYFQHNDRPPLR
ncbi:MAG: tetratricopeptide repeat protein [Planctomycetales bacterium]|nr:tetratricopeptide repeat protein [Planctomycetales bacterium]